MFLEICANLAAAAGGLLVATFIIHFIHEAYKINKSYTQFKRDLRGIPVGDSHWIVGGSIHRNANNPRNWQNVAEDHKRFGKNYAIMYGPIPCVMSMDAEIIKRLAIDEHERHPNRIKWLGLPIDEFEVDDILLARDDQWRRLRRNIAPAFTSYKIKAPNVQEEMGNSVDKFIEAIETQIRRNELAKGDSSTVLDAEDWFHRYVLDLVFTCFYKQDNQIDFYSKRDYWQQVTERGMLSVKSLGVSLVLHFPILRPLVRFFLLRFDPYGLMRRKLFEFINKQARQNFEAKQKLKLDQKTHDALGEQQVTLDDGVKFRRNMMDFVIDRFHEGNMSHREYLNSTFLLFFAAHKTTTDGLSKLIYHIAKHPDVQEKLRDSILKDGAECEYLNWCIHESLRLFPPALGGASRTTGYDVTFDSGITIPKDTIVFTSAYSVNRDKDYWGQDADEFKPERWANAKSFHPAQFLSFGVGKRSCLGRDFALHGIKRVADKLLRNYKFEYVSGPNDEMLFEAPFFIFCVFNGPTNIRITRL